MPSVTVDNSTTFDFTDSGPPSLASYTTIVFIHHDSAGVFQKVARLAGSKQLRTIILTPRKSSSTTAYSVAAQQAILGGSTEQRRDFLQKEGISVAIAIDRVITQLSLPENVAIAGFSRGLAFVVTIYGLLSKIPTEVSQRLKKYVKSFILLSPSNWVLGIPDPSDAYVPLWDEALPADQRGSTFLKWISSYFQHGGLTSRNVSQLQKRSTDALKRTSTEGMNPGSNPTTDNLSTTDFQRFDSFANMRAFSPLLTAQTNNLLDAKVRATWGRPTILVLYGNASVWCDVHAAWFLEAAANASNGITVNAINGGNHYFLWDYPEKTLDVLKEFTAKAN
ncbi:hypothetical protein H0H92_007837 [Tricholoma furcatifolium]|nr:hypothetical protein H0H92_007837 [Tricholoma furcatifolium]